MHRADYRAEPGLEDAVFMLMEHAFPGISSRRTEAAALGSRWADASIPFVARQGDRVVSHIGLLDMPYVIDGNRCRLGGVHGVATHATARRRGLYRALMEELLDYCEGRFETLELSTANPEYYEPFGFRVLTEHRFHCPVEHPGGRDGLRPFRVGERADMERMDRLLQLRSPVSNRVGVFEEEHVFKFTQGSIDLQVCDALDCLLVGEVVNGSLRLYDVVAETLPGLDAILEQVADPVTRVEFYFSPDRFEVNCSSEPCRWDGGVLMVRGPFPEQGSPFLVPPPARH